MRYNNNLPMIINVQAKKHSFKNYYLVEQTEEIINSLNSLLIIEDIKINFEHIAQKI